MPPRFFTLSTLFIFTALLIAVPAIANEFVPLAPIPNLDTGNDATLASYLNSVFNFAISIGGVLAVLMIVKSGFLYMTTEAISQKGNARTELQNAIFGLILLLMSYLMLQIVNPNLLKIDPFAALNQTEAPAPTSTPSPIQSQETFTPNDPPPMSP